MKVSIPPTLSTNTLQEFIFNSFYCVTSSLYVYIWLFVISYFYHLEMYGCFSQVLKRHTITIKMKRYSILLQIPSLLLPHPLGAYFIYL